MTEYFLKFGFVLLSIIHFVVCQDKGQGTSEVLINGITALSQGSTLHLTCTTNSASSLTDFVWTKDDEELRSDDNVAASVLTISRVTADDEGSYTCRANNISSLVDVTIGVHIDYEESNLPHFWGIEPHEAVDISCKATGSEPIGYSWQHNGHPIANATTSTLTIANASSSDQGEYRCIVENKVDNKTSHPVIVRLVVSFDTYAQTMNLLSQHLSELQELNKTILSSLQLEDDLLNQTRESVTKLLQDLTPIVEAYSGTCLHATSSCKSGTLNCSVNTISDTVSCRLCNGTKDEPCPHFIRAAPSLPVSMIHAHNFNCTVTDDGKIKSCIGMKNSTIPKCKDCYSAEFEWVWFPNGTETTRLYGDRMKCDCDAFCNGTVDGNIMCYGPVADCSLDQGNAPECSFDETDLTWSEAINCSDPSPSKANLSMTCRVTVAEDQYAGYLTVEWDDELSINCNGKGKESSTKCAGTFARCVEARTNDTYTYDVSNCAWQVQHSEIPSTTTPTTAASVSPAEANQKNNKKPTATSEPMPTATSEPMPTATSEPMPTATSELMPTATSEPAPTNVTDTSSGTPGVYGINGMLIVIILLIIVAVVGYVVYTNHQKILLCFSGKENRPQRTGRRAHPYAPLTNHID